MSPAASPDPRIGTVARFDEATGWGIVAGEDGARYPLHCTAIADGRRMIEAGIAVIFHLTPGRSGQWEAAGVTPRLPR
ncbi:MAG: cold shock domain-containing protein [bacterium]|nr:cold shock domain-containing protein [bacterium]MCY4271920.1 cold shock domain-containing protein [bacterium]